MHILNNNDHTTEKGAFTAMRRLTAAIAALCIVFAGCSSISALQPKPTPTPSLPAQTPTAQAQPEAVPAVKLGDEVPVSRALVAKMLSAAFMDLIAMDGLNWDIPFGDVQKEAWYGKYVNAAFVNGFMAGSDGQFLPDKPITLSQAQVLMDNLNPNNTQKLKIDDNNKDKPISYALWVSLFKKCLEEMAGGKSLKEAYNMDERVFVVLATPDNNSALPPFHMMTDKGPFTYAGLNMAPYIDKAVRVLVKDGDVVAVLALESETPTIYNAYVVESGNGHVTIFSGGAQRTYKSSGSLPKDAGKICDITISGEIATGLNFFEEKTNGVVKRTAPAEIEFDNRVIPIGENFKIYSIAGEKVKWKNLSDITVGQNLGYFVLKDGKAAACVLTQKPKCNQIRVAIGTTGYAGLIHDKAAFTSNGTFTVTASGQSTTYNPGQTFAVTKELFANNRRVTIAPVDANGTLQILSITRAWAGNANPSYRGVMEVSPSGNGYVIVNEVDMEQYLYSVVPSEMPSGYGVEASKVQAVTARSYAVSQLWANRYHNYGANVDDSVSSQVYNNIPENDTSIQAVNATKGQCLTFNGNPVTTNFFSTSCGMTANSGEVWGDSITKQFPTLSQPYMQAIKQHNGPDYGDLRLEDNAAAFFKATNIQGFDSTFAWFRWKTEMTAAEIGASINKHIGSRFNTNPPYIKTLGADGVFRSTPIDTIGDLLDLQVVKRGEGGNIMVMQATGTQATVQIITEYNVRALIRPTQYVSGGKPIATTLKDGSVQENYSLMPSAFYTMDKTYDNNGKLVKVAFTGGGNGHGVGMSQNGVKGMIDSGKTFDAILLHYYPGTEIKTIE